MRLSILLFLLLIACVSNAQHRTYFTETRRIALPDSALTLAIEARAAFKKNDLRNKWWGIAWNRTSADCYHYASIRCESSGYDDILDSRFMTVTIGKRNGNIDTTLSSTHLTRDIDLYNGFNSIAIEWESDTATILVGSNELIPVAKIPMPCPSDTASIIGEGEINVGLMVSEYTPLHIPLDTPQMTIDRLDSIFASSSDPLEGYWTYLDRATDDRRARLGGTYRIAIVRDGYDYNIFYISGATVNPDAWQSGMLKARLTATAFVNQFDATWYDSLLAPLDREVHARFDNSSLLTIEFPLLGSQLRFSKAFPH